MQLQLDQEISTARFQPGASALGHHWDLLDADGAVAGRTQRIYPGGLAGRLPRKTATATGFAGDDILAEVIGADGLPAARILSSHKHKRVDVSQPRRGPDRGGAAGQGRGHHAADGRAGRAVPRSGRLPLLALSTHAA